MHGVNLYQLGGAVSASTGASSSTQSCQTINGKQVCSDDSQVVVRHDTSCDSSGNCITEGYTRKCKADGTDCICKNLTGDNVICDDIMVPDQDDDSADSGTANDPRRPHGLRPNGEYCRSNFDCSSNVCHNGICHERYTGPKKEMGASCISGSDCQTGTCAGGKCTTFAEATKGITSFFSSIFSLSKMSSWCSSIISSMIIGFLIYKAFFEKKE